MDSFTRAYIQAALFSTNDDAGDPLDKNYGCEDLAPSALAAMTADCERFQDEHGTAIDRADISEWSARVHGVRYPKRERAGHDFWFTRNGHGAGFWDGDWPEPQADALTKASETFGQCDLYVGDDGLIYVAGRED